MRQDNVDDNAGRAFLLGSILFFGFVVLLCCGCGGSKHDEQDDQDQPRSVTLKIEYAKRLEALAGMLDPEFGWPSRTDCDGLLWAGLACSVGLDRVDYLEAEYAPGEWHRRPAPSCWVDGPGDQGARSTISGDMFQGVFACAWTRSDAAALERLAAYGEANGWVMGKPYPEAADRVVLRPNQVGMLGQLLYATTNGSVDKAYRDWPAFYAPPDKDFGRHLQALEIGLRGQVEAWLAKRHLQATQTPSAGQTGLTGVTTAQLERLRGLNASDPNDPLFAATLGTYEGGMGKAIDLLLNPATPVPTYVRCDAQPACELVAWLKAASIVLHHTQQ